MGLGNTGITFCWIEICILAPETMSSASTPCTLPHIHGSRRGSPIPRRTSRPVCREPGTRGSLAPDGRSLCLVLHPWAGGCCLGLHLMQHPGLEAAASQASSAGCLAAAELLQCQGKAAVGRGCPFCTSLGLGWGSAGLTRDLREGWWGQNHCHGQVSCPCSVLGPLLGAGSSALCCAGCGSAGGTVLAWSAWSDSSLHTLLQEQEQADPRKFNNLTLAVFIYDRKTAHLR